MFFGAGLGGAMRHGVNIAAFRLFGAGFPYGTWSVNVIGSVAMGLLAGWFGSKADLSQSWQLFLATGLLGGFTTFSAFSLDVMLLYERGAPALAATYVILSIVLSLGGLFIGLLVMKQLG